MVDTEQLFRGLLELGMEEPAAARLIHVVSDDDASLADLAALLGRLPEHAVKAAQSLECVEDLHGLRKIHQRYCRMVRNAEEEILVFVRPPYACDDLEKVDEQIREYDAFMERGGLLRWVFEVDSPGQAELVAAMVEPIENRAQVRVAARLPLKLMVFDRREVLLMQDDALTSPTDLAMTWIRHGDVAEAFRSLFGYVFERSLDYPTWMREKMHSQRVLGRLAPPGKGPDPDETTRAMETGP